MEMDTGILVSEAIVHVHDKLITFVDLDDGQWPSIVETNDFPLLQAIRVGHNPCEVEVVCYNCCPAYCEQQRHGEDGQDKTAACHVCESKQHQQVAKNSINK